jgi:hypothetical protein
MVPWLSRSGMGTAARRRTRKAKGLRFSTRRSANSHHRYRRLPGDRDDVRARPFALDAGFRVQFNRLPRHGEEGLEPGGGGLSFMRTAGDRIGMMTYPGMVGDNPTWVELDFEGKLIGQWSLRSDFGIDRGYAGAYAYTADGRLYAQAFSAGVQQQTLWIYNRATSSWNAASGPDLRSFLMGSDGNSLVFRSAGASSAVGIPLVWFPAP